MGTAPGGGGAPLGTNTGIMNPVDIGGLGGCGYVRRADT
jgi:hypothetical protein